ncbi:MAG: pantoate--beta-alanine ligase [Myxococcota bacterium]
MTEIIHDPAALRRRCDGARASGRTVGLVPTMGALHAGHLALVDQARERGADFVVVTLFVNPKQFGPGEDFERYPRTLDTDRDACRACGVDVLFAPPVDAVYPAGFQTHVEVEELTQPFEGAHRPGHFRGVTTVVTKLLLLAAPCTAVFGRKDYQQWKVIDRMARDLFIPVDIVGMPTVREPDGLALSSRNRYLEPDQRERALGLVRGLRAAAGAWARGERDPDLLRRLARAPVEAAFDRVDYVDVADPETLAPLRGPSATDRAVVLMAAHLGTTRLIDNLVLGEEPIP